LGYNASDMPFLTRDFTVGDCSNLSADTQAEEENAEEDTTDDEIAEDDNVSGDGGSTGDQVASGSGGGTFHPLLFLLLVLSSLPRTLSRIRFPRAVFQSGGRP